MSRANLAKRSRGFAAYEIALIKTPHTGWVKYLSSNTIQLRKSKFTEIYTPQVYRLPPDLNPIADAFVKLEVDGSEKILDKKIQDKQRYYDVQKIEPLDLFDLNSSRPYLGQPQHNIEAMFPEVRERYPKNKDKFDKGKEFLSRISYYWKNAEEDRLDWALAIQLLSCPNSVYGIGGIGSASFSDKGSTKESIKDVQKAIRFMLPRDFTSSNDLYEYHFIDQEHDYSAVKSKRMITTKSEISYNYLYHLPPGFNGIPIQIPTIIRNAEFTGKKAPFDPDILEYIIYAILLTPPVDNNLMCEIERSVRLVNKKKKSNITKSSSIDSYAITKLAMTLCRIELGNKLDDAYISRAANLFTEMYKNYLDVRDRCESDPYLRTWNVDGAKTLDMNGELLSKDMKVRYIISNISEELGIEWVPLHLIKERANINDNTDLMFSLQLLMDHGHIIAIKNMNEFKVI
jgi:hypothetical protein